MYSKCMNLTPLAQVAASGPGSLPAYESKCSCGLVIRSSLRTIAVAGCAAHLAWHERRGK